MLPEPQPTRDEKIIRFVFGFAAGVVAGVTAWVQLAYGFDLALGITVLAGLLFGGLAVRFGDEFWRVLLKCVP